MPKAEAHVLLISHHYPPHIGGLELVAERQAHDLARHGYKVSVLTSHWPPSGQYEMKSGVEIFRVSAWHVLERKLFVPYPFFFPSFLAKAWRKINLADIVHIHDVFYLSSWIGAIFAAILRKPILLTQHVAMVDHRSRLVMLAQRLIYATVGRWIFSQARKIVAYNRNVHEFLLDQRVDEQRILRIVNGIDTQAFRPPIEGEKEAIRKKYGLPLDRHLVLFVGRLVDKKGVRILLEAKNSAFDLVFVGPGPTPQHEDKVGIHWLGPLGQEGTAELYRACDLFAFPAIGEIFTLAMQEAMASALPVITTNDDAYIGSDLADGVVLCARMPNRLRETILKLLSNKQERSSLGARCRTSAIRHFDWTKNFSGILDAYAEEIYKP